MVGIMRDGCKVLQLHIVGTLQFIILKNVLLPVGRIVAALQLAPPPQNLINAAKLFF